jgi:hypothetical protein
VFSAEFPLVLYYRNISEPNLCSRLAVSACGHSRLTHIVRLTYITEGLCFRINTDAVLGRRVMGVCIHTQYHGKENIVIAKL